MNKLVKQSYTLQKEYKFHPTRKWRFDYAIPEIKIAIEVEGGIFSNGRHTRGLGYLKDMEKYNEATILGWSLLRYTPQQFNQFKYIEDIEKIINNTVGIIDNNSYL